MTDVNKGILLAFLAYGTYACSDAFVKAAGGMPVFVIGLYVTAFALVPVALFKPGHEKWAEVFVLNNPKIVHLRAASGVLAGMCAFYAFTTLPLAEAYAIIFLIPAFSTLIAIFVLKEPVGWRRWLAVILGFAGILIVIRPGFREIEPGHIAGLGTAFFGAVTITALRRLSTSEKMLSLIAMVGVWSFGANGLLAAVFTGFPLPERDQFYALVGAGLMAGFAQIAIIRASGLAPASTIAPTQYSQMIWAIAIGYFAFAEVPEPATFAGMAVIAFSGMLIFIREEKRIGPRRRITLLRNRL